MSVFKQGWEKTYGFLKPLLEFRFFSFLRYLVFKLLDTKNTTKEPAYTKSLSARIHCYDERYEIIITPINSIRFTDFDLKI